MRKLLFKITHSLAFYLILLLVMIFSFTVSARQPKPPLKVGYSIQIASITPEKMNYAKSVGVDCIETTMNQLINSETLEFKYSNEEIVQKLKKAKKAANDAGIEIWSIHMPFGKNIDLSFIDESERQKVVSLHKEVIEYCRILQPKIILFHPSFFLGLNERELRKEQLIKSAIELSANVKDIDAIMVIENMLGPELLVDAKRERPLCRSVEETVEIMGRLPQDIYSAIDMNHIKDPENLIRAMGNRLKTVHVSDGDGIKERHYFPCSGQGKNNWTEILAALDEVQYTGPFMYESAYEDAKDFRICYESLYKTYKAEKSK